MLAGLFQFEFFKLLILAELRAKLPTPGFRTGFNQASNVTPNLKSLHWLPLKWCVDVQFLLLSKPTALGQLNLLLYFLS